MENAGRFVEDDELKEKLKDSGLGTPATRAAIIERLLQVGYIIRKGKALAATEKGMKLVQVVPRELSSPETTGKWEKGLSSIAKGKMDDKRFMESIVRYVNFIVKSPANSSMSVVFPEENRRAQGNTKGSAVKAICKCPKCSEGEILENSKGYYCTRWKNGCKFTIWKGSLEKLGVSSGDAIIRALCGMKTVQSVKAPATQANEPQTVGIVLSADMSGRIEVAQG